MEYQTPTLTPAQFERVRRLARVAGLKLEPAKEPMVKARLLKRMRALGLMDFDAYFRRLDDGSAPEEARLLLDNLTTNKTSFFREADHFEFLKAELSRAGDPRRLRFWSAGCSSGEEPYSLAMALWDSRRDPAGVDLRILATDLSDRMLAQARQAVYPSDTLGDLPPLFWSTYFTCVDPRPPRRYRVAEFIRRLVSLARLNLMDEWPMRGPFDAIFCRNVMIYFDKRDQENLVARFVRLLSPAGCLFVGHSESLASLRAPLVYVRPGIYRRSAALDMAAGPSDPGLARPRNSGENADRRP